jgi:UDP-glucose 4-epimerase
MRPHSKKVVVTGAAGFIGGHLCDALVREGYAVHAIDNLVNGKREDVPKEAAFYEVDVRDTHALTDIFAGAECVFHLAALPRIAFSHDFPQESHDANINGTFSVLLAARAANVERVIYAGSSSSYGVQPALPFTEDMPPHPASLYALQKLVGEEYARLFAHSYGLATATLRFFNVYGPRMRAAGGYALAVPAFLAARQAGKPLTITGDGTQSRDFTHIRDTVRACLLALTSEKIGKGEVINVCAGRNVTIARLAELIGGPVEHAPPRPGDLPHTFGSNAKAKALLGWAPEIALEDGIAELLIAEAV